MQRMDQNQSSVKFIEGAQTDQNDEVDLRNGDAASQKSPSRGKAGICVQLKTDPVFRKKFRYSMFTALSLMALGMFVGQLGPTFLDLQIITNTSLEESSAFFTSGNAGYMTGSILAGLVYDKMNKPFLMFICTLLLGVSNILIPYCTKYGVMIFLRVIVGIFAGGVDTGANAEHMRIWGTDADELMHFLHFCFSFGGVISPLVSESFLAKKIPFSSNDSSLNNNRTSGYSNTSEDTHPSRMTETHVEYVFLITGVFVILTSFPFLFTCIEDWGKPQETKEERKFSQRNVPLPLLIVMLVGVCIFYFMYCCVEDTFFSFLMAFLVGEFRSVSKSRGAFTTAVAWASFAAARFLMIFVSKLLTPLKLLIAMTISMVVAFTCFTAFAHYGIVQALVYLAALSAMSMSGVFPAGFSWMESKMFMVTGVISSCILVASSLGTILNPLVIGFLMEKYDTMWFCYLLLIETFVLGCLLVSMIVLTQCFVDRKYGAMENTSSSNNAATETSQSMTEAGENEDETKVQFLTT